MKTKLDAIAGFLAGREDGAATLRAELADPASEASLFLEATRARSRSLMAEPGVAAPAEPARGRRPARRRILPIAAGLFGLALAIGVPLGVGAIRDRRLEAARDARDAGTRAELDRLAAALANAPRPPGPPPSRDPAIEATLARLEAALADQGRLLDALARAEPKAAPAAPTRPDPSLAEIRAEMAAIRRELAADQLASGRQFQDLKTIVQELNEILRRVLGRPDRPPNGGPRPMRLPVPGFEPGGRPGQG